MLEKGKIWTVSGITASGKSTLGALLAKSINSQFIPEEWETNPYLDRFNQGIGSFLDAEIWFIERDWSRYQEAQELALKGLNVVVDKPFYLNHLYVDIAPLTEFQKEYSHELILKYMNLITIHADLNILMHISPEMALSRIRQRGRTVEQCLSLEWIKLLNDSFNNNLYRWINMPTLNLDSKDYDLTNHKNFLECIFRQNNY